MVDEKNISAFSSFLKQHEEGQTAVEYIMLMAVIVIFALTVFRSDAFRNILGEESYVFDLLKNSLEYNYVHAGAGLDPQDFNFESRYQSPHSSLINERKGITHFYITLKYPDSN